MMALLQLAMGAILRTRRHTDYHQERLEPIYRNSQKVGGTLHILRMGTRWPHYSDMPRAPKHLETGVDSINADGVCQQD